MNGLLSLLADVLGYAVIDSYLMHCDCSLVTTRERDLLTQCYEDTNEGKCRDCGQPMNIYAIHGTHNTEHARVARLIRLDGKLEPMGARAEGPIREAVAEVELLREWIDGFGRNCPSSTSVDGILERSRNRVPPPID